MARIGFIGFGELATALAEPLREGGHHLRAYVPTRTDPEAARATGARLANAGTAQAATIAAAAEGASAVLCVVPGSAARAVAETCAPALERGALYVDMAAAAVEAKEAAARAVGEHGGRYVDVAVMGTVAVSGAAVPMLASGEGAAAFQALVAPAGLSVTAIDEPAGRATLVKLLRSVYLKGRDALVVEMLLAARRHGLENEVLDSIGGPGEQVPFRSLAERILTALAVHSGRRADELSASASVVRDAGVEPVLTAAAERRLRALADLGLREILHGERPSDAGAVLAAIDDLSAAPRGDVG